MDITSFAYLLLVSISLMIYWIIPYKYQWYVLLLDSLIFYFLNVSSYTFVYVAVSSITVWLASLYFDYVDHVQPEVEEGKRKAVLIVTLSVNIGILALLKYTNFGIHTLNIISSILGFRNEFIPEVRWTAPLGISFYTLQLISYLLDCYWGIISAEKNPLKVLLFTLYFPQMVSGPISRYKEIGYQFYEEHRFDYQRTTAGMKRIAYGLVKKMAIANRIHMIVNYMWNNYVIYNGIFVWFAVALFLVELYSDFSGCMDIIIGVSKCFGIDLPENFKAPFYSKNVQEYWRRWHITLGQWLKDYIMNPLLKTNWLINLGEKARIKFGKKKGRKVPSYVAMFFVWSAMGLWHGNSWKYIIGEGWWFWLILVTGQIFSEELKKISKILNMDNSMFWNVLRMVRTNIFILVGMIFFRSDSLIDAVRRINTGLSLPEGWKSLLVQVFVDNSGNIGGYTGFLVLAVSFIIMVVVDGYIYRGNDIISTLDKRNILVRWMLYFCFVLIIMLSYNVQVFEFAYAQF